MATTDQKVNKEVRTGLMLHPDRISKTLDLASVLVITKTNGIPDYTMHSPEGASFHRYIKGVPQSVFPFFRQFGETINQEHLQLFRHRFKMQRSGMEETTYLAQAMIRHHYDVFDRLKPYAHLAKWYHQKPVPGRGVLTAPCKWSSYRPQVTFKVVKQKKHLFVETSFNINGTLFGATQFVRTHFLAERNNEYFLLGYKDMQTLDWLESFDTSMYGLDTTRFVQEVLLRLEENNVVDRNNLFPKIVINSEPQRRVLLQEISNNFLMLTPQWVYEGIVTEGEYKTSVELLRNGDLYEVQRHRQHEDAFVQFLRNLHPRFSAQLNGTFHLSFAEAQKGQWFFKVYHRLLDENVEITGMDLLRQFRYSPHTVATKATIVEESGEQVILDMEVSFGKELVPLQELQKVLLAGQKAVLLRDGSLGILHDGWIQQYGLLLKHGKAKGSVLKAARWMALSEDDTANEVLKPIIKAEWWQRWRQWQSNSDAVYALPGAVQATMRPYQQKGYEWLSLLAEAGAGACLADDMGLGKTLQTIAFITRQIEAGMLKKHLIVCPASLIYNWLQEWEKFAPSITVAVYHGNNRNRSIFDDDETQVIISSYGTIRSDSDMLALKDFGVVVLDESHNIKNPNAQITRAVLTLPATTRIALSGTPVMNNTFDLFAQLSFLLPGMFGSREFFKREYADPIERERNADKIAALRKLTNPFILRRTKEQVATDLPPKTESILWCRMGHDQHMAYETIKEQVRSSVMLDIKQQGFEKGKLSVINGLLKLRQVCNHCELVKNEDLFCSDSIKTDILLAEIANLVPEHKVLVFSQFTQMLDLLETALDKADLDYLRLDGSTEPAQRQQLVNRFQDSKAPEKIFLLSLKAGNAGLNLTEADYVFIFDPWWNPAVERQAIDRTHRIGQNKNVFAYKMVCKGTVEERILQLQQRKKQLAEELVSEEEGFVKNLSEDDLSFLLD
jgi:superfamily II DNA or RNA helicase